VSALRSRRSRANSDCHPWGCCRGKPRRPGDEMESSPQALLVAANHPTSSERSPPDLSRCWLDEAPHGQMDVFPCPAITPVSSLRHGSPPHRGEAILSRRVVGARL
jgi:hypothetical protein